MYGNPANLYKMRKLFVVLASILMLNLLFSPVAHAKDDLALSLSDPRFLGDTSMNILFEIKNYSEKNIEILTIYSNDEFPARDAKVIIGPTYPFVGSLDPSYSDFYKYHVLVRGYLLTEFRYVQGFAKTVKTQFRKTGFKTYNNYYSNVIDMRAYNPNF